jgi:hypothetical protein
MPLTLTKSPVNTRVSLTKPASYAIHVTHPDATHILPLFFRDEARALDAMSEVWTSLDGGSNLFQCWLVSPSGRLIDYRGPVSQEALDRALAQAEYSNLYRDAR